MLLFVAILGIFFVKVIILMSKFKGSSVEILWIILYKLLEGHLLEAFIKCKDKRI